MMQASYLNSMAGLPAFGTHMVTKPLAKHNFNTLIFK